MKTRVLAFLRLDESSLGDACFDSALALQTRFGGKGQIYWVGNVGPYIHLPVALVCHYYYVPPGSNDNELALNHADSGYGEFPQFTVGEVKMIGDCKD